MTIEQENYSKVVGRYIRGEMSENEISQLEIDLMDNEVLFNEVRVQSLLKEGINSTKEVKAIERNMLLKQMGEFISGLQAATSFLLIIVTIQAYLLIERGSTIDELMEPTLDVEVIVISEERGNLFPDKSFISVNNGGKSRVLLKIDASALSDMDKVEIYRGKNIIASYEDVEPNEYGYIDIYLVGELNELYRIGVKDIFGQCIKFIVVEFE